MTDLAALKERLRHAGASDGMNAFECRQMLAGLEGIEAHKVALLDVLVEKDAEIARLSAPVVGEALVEAAARIICRHVHECAYPGAPWREGQLDNKVDAYWPKHADAARAVLAVVVPAVREECAGVADQVAGEWPDTPEGRNDDWRHGRQDGAMEVAAALRQFPSPDRPAGVR